jgi:predicted protein tyrosine phosphatase
MEPKHGRILREKSCSAPIGKEIICLPIADIYRKMQPSLIKELKAALSGHVEVPE